MPESLEHRVRELEHSVAKLIQENQARRLLSLALFASHPDRRHVLDCYEFLHAHWTELSDAEALAEPLLSAAEREVQEFGKLLLGLQNIDIPRSGR